MEKKTEYKIGIGSPVRMGTYAVGNSVNFTVTIPDDKEAKLVLTDPTGCEILARIDLPTGERFGDVSCVNVSAGSTKISGYYYEIEGKKYLDPYARKIKDDVCFVDYERFNWDGDKAPGHKLSDLIIYKFHVRGFTKDPRSGVRDKGTYKGVIQKIPYIRKMGFTAVELMPAYEWNDQLGDPSEEKQKAPEASLSMLRGNLDLNEALGQISTETEEAPERKNYWGYSPQNYYFAPKQSFSSSEDSVTEFRNMVKALHREGIECFMEFYVAPGTSVTYVLEALRNWKLAYHIDGFHLLGTGVSKEAILEDPILAHTKIFMDYFDDDQKACLKRRTAATYNIGFQNNARRFLKGDENIVGSFMWSLRANPDAFGVVNYVANVDGFTLLDAVSYNEKHNEANGENNFDGSYENYSWNSGLEGPTKKKKTIQLRKKQIRNAFSYCLLSQGIPLVYAGDEFGNSQDGNNNAYSSDDPMGWVNWDRGGKYSDITDYVRKLIAFRKEHPILHPDRSLRGTDYRNLGYPDISFHDTKAWYYIEDPKARSLGVMLNGAYEGEDRFYIYMGFNAHWNPHTFALPSLPCGMKWIRTIESAPDETEEIRDQALKAAIARMVDVANERAVIATARAEHALEVEKNEKATREYYLRQKEEEQAREAAEKEEEQARQAAETAEETADTAEIEAETAEIETETAGIETGTAEIETETAEIETGTAEIKTETAGIETGTAEIKTETAGIKAETAEKKAETAEDNSEIADKKADEAENESAAESIERRIAERIMFGRHSAAALKKSADEAWAELERVKKIDTAPVFPEDQRFIMVPARSVTILTAVPEE